MNITMRYYRDAGLVLQSEVLQTLAVTTDWDFPSIASAFGWRMSDLPGLPGHVSCYHEGSDGTIDCPGCGRSATDFIADAGRYLKDIANTEVWVEDPGWFMTEQERNEAHGGLGNYRPSGLRYVDLTWNCLPDKPYVDDEGLIRGVDHDNVGAGPGFVTCPECGRVFDLTNPTDADELINGHDCES